MRLFPRRRFAKWFIFLTFSVSLGLAGCSGEPTGTVSGKVYSGTTLLKGGHVTFTSKTGKGSRVVDIQKDGSYVAPDLPVGEAKIAVETDSMNVGGRKPPRANTPPPGQKPPGGSPPPSPAENLADRYVRIRAEYANTDSSPLIYPVKPGPQEYEIKLEEPTEKAP